MADQRATVTPCRRQVVEYQSAILLRGKATWISDAQPASPWLCRDGFRQCFREARVGRQGCWSPTRSAVPFRAWRTGGALRPSRGRVAVSGGDAPAVAQAAEDSRHMPVSEGANDSINCPAFEKAVDRGMLRQLGQVGQGAFPGLPVLAEGFAQEDSRRRAAIRDAAYNHGHGHHYDRNFSVSREEMTSEIIYMDTNRSTQRTQKHANSCKIVRSG